MEKILSIVIPSYNVEAYLEQTLESFVAEEILGEIEVLVIDDGSADRTAEIGKMFQDQYPETFRVISKKNGGHGSTINRGAEECKGRYFKVVDGDDWVKTEDFAQLVQRLKACDADCVVTDYYEVNDQTKALTEKTFPKLKELTDGGQKNVPFESAAACGLLPMHALTIKSSILKENEIRMDENSFYVDVEYVLFPVPYIRTVTYFPLFIYMYRLAVATQSVSMQGYRRHIQNHMDVILHLAEFAENYRKESRETCPEKMHYIGKRIAQMAGDQVTIFLSYPADDKENKRRFQEFDAALKEKSRWIYELSGKESGLLSALRKTKFRGYRFLMKSGQKRNGIEVL